MPYFLRPPYIFLILGSAFVCMGVISTFTGEAWSTFGRVVYRAKEPNQFWWAVVVDCLGGAVLIGYFLYKVT